RRPGSRRSSWKSRGSAAPESSSLGPSSLLRRRLLFLDLDLFLGDLDIHVFLREAVRRHLLLAEPLLPGGLLAEDLLQDVVDVNRAALDAAGRIDAVLAELELDDRVRRVPDRPVFLDFEVFEGVDQPALHVPRAGRPDGRVDEPFPTSHRVEEVLRRVEAALVRRFDESFRLRAEVALPEVRQGAVPVAATQALATDRLLSNRPRHLREVQHAAASPGPRQ